MSKITLTHKQKESILNANKTWNIKIGATRSGKTWLDFTYRIPKKTRELKDEDGLFFIMGASQANIERNILEPMRDIYGDKRIGNIQSGKSIVMLFGQVYHVVGHEKKNAITRIQGASIKYCYVDEIVRMHKDVFEMLKSRLDKDYSVCDSTGNPEQPSHFFKKFIDEEHDKGDMFVQSYTIDDNPTLPESFVTRLKREYYGTVYYNRYILGQWTMAEGQIYPMFDRSRHLVDVSTFYDKDDSGNWTHEIRKNIQTVHIGIDFGGNESKTTFQCTGLVLKGNRLDKIITIKERRFTEEKDSTYLENEFNKFVQDTLSLGYKIRSIRADSAEQTLIRGMQNSLVNNNLNYKIMNAKKGVILERIRTYQRLLNTDRYLVLSDCLITAEAFENAIWSDKVDSEGKDIRLDDGTVNIDTLDAQEYSTEELHKLLIKD